MKEEKFRNKITWITFLFSLLVVWAHSYNAELFLGQGEAFALADRIQKLLGENLGQAAVPGFFMVSAYLFYRRFTPDRLPEKWRFRAKSVLIPYLVWNFLYYGAYAAAARIPAVSRLVGKEAVPVNLGELAFAVLRYGYNPVFWYLYQLILLILLAPVLWLVLRRTWTGVMALGMLLFALWSNEQIPYLNLDALFYYGTAAFIGIHRDSWGSFLEKELTGKGIFAEGLGLGAAFIGINGLSAPGGLFYGRALSIVALRFWYVCAFWFLIKALPVPEARAWMKNSFFLYAIHFALVRLLNKSGALMLPHSMVSAMSLFFLMPLLMVGASFWLGKAVQGISPGLYSILSGGR